jgi:excisionase family DNA binding protein
MSSESSDLLRTEQVAKLLNVAPGTVRNWVRLGRIRSVRLPGGQYRIPREEVEKLLQGRDEP